MSPDVGADVVSVCGKCGESWHIVVAKVNQEIVKVECQRCRKQHKYRDPEKVRARKAGTAKKKKAAANSEKKGLTSTGRKRKLRRGEIPNGPPKPKVAIDESKEVRTYKMNESYAPGERVEHPRFGTGVVEGSPGSGRVEICFEDARRILKQAKPESSLQRRFG